MAQRFDVSRTSLSVNNEIEYIYSEKMNKLKEALKVKQRAWPLMCKRINDNSLSL